MSNFRVEHLGLETAKKLQNIKDKPLDPTKINKFLDGCDEKVAALKEALKDYSSSTLLDAIKAQETTLSSELDYGTGGAKPRDPLEPVVGDGIFGLRCLTFFVCAVLGALGRLGTLEIVFIASCVTWLVGALAMSGQKNRREQYISARDRNAKRKQLEQETNRVQTLNEEQSSIQQAVDNYQEMKLVATNKILAVSKHLHDSSAELYESALYSSEITVDPKDQETKAHPKISWFSNWLTVDFSEDAQALTDKLFNDKKIDKGDLKDVANKMFSEGENKLAYFFDLGIAPSIKIYSNSGGLVAKNYSKECLLVFEDTPSGSGEYIDQRVSPGDVVNYYLILECRFQDYFLNSNSRFDTGVKLVEFVIKKTTLKVPEFIDDEMELKEQIKKRTITKKRQKFKETVEQTEARESGVPPGSDIDASDFLRKRREEKIAKEKHERELQKIRTALEDEGATEEEIFEAIEEYEDLVIK